MSEPLVHPCVYGLSLGPGDPGLVTLKALGILKAVDRVYYPGSLDSSGTRRSRSLEILRHHGIDEGKSRGFFIRMASNRAEAEATYAETFRLFEEDYRSGLSVAVVAEGDIAFFSTFGPLWRRIRDKGLALRMVPGVPAFLHAASEGAFPLTQLGERLAVLPEFPGEKELGRILAEFDVVVLMKISSRNGELKAYLEREKPDFFYAEELGWPGQFLTRDVRELAGHSVRYFSLLILGRAPGPGVRKATAEAWKAGTEAEK